jgi:hypothetical protein
MNARRTAGLSLAAYGLATLVMAVLGGTPGGAYEPAKVTSFLSFGHFWTIAAASYVGALGALALIPFSRSVGPALGAGTGAVPALGTDGAAAGVVGAFLSGGIADAAAEGGDAVRAGLPLPVAHTLGEIGGLVGGCGPALCVGVIAVVLAVRADLAPPLRAVCFVAGACGILAPFYFTVFAYLLWTLGFGVWLVAGRRRAVYAEPSPSMV